MDLDGSEFSEVFTITSSDSDPPQPPKTPRSPRKANPLKRFWHEGNEYVEVKDLAKSVRTDRRKKTSPIWKLGREVKRVTDEKSFWRCSICKKEGETIILSSSA